MNPEAVSSVTRDAKEIAKLPAMVPLAPLENRNANPLKNGPFVGSVPQVSDMSRTGAMAQGETT